jgi:hypothetical protein
MFFGTMFVLVLMRIFGYRYTKKGWKLRKEIFLFKEKLKEIKVRDKNEFLKLLPFAYALNIQKEFIKNNLKEEFFDSQ